MPHGVELVDTRVMGVDAGYRGRVGCAATSTSAHWCRRPSNKSSAEQKSAQGLATKVSDVLVRTSGRVMHRTPPPTLVISSS